MTVSSTYRRVALLGSSYAAGPAIEPIINAAAGPSGNNYGEILARRLGAKITDLAVSGATTTNLLSTTQRINRHRFAAQIPQLPADADLIMVTAGGNDLGYLQAMIAPAAAGWMSAHAVTRPLGRLLRTVSGEPGAKDTEVAATGLARVVQAARARVAGARVILVGYPTLIGPDTMTSAELPIAARDLAAIRRIGERLDRAYELAAERTGADLIKSWELSRDHAIGSAEPWVNGIRSGSDRGQALHHNASGHRALADAVLALIN